MTARLYYTVCECYIAFYEPSGEHIMGFRVQIGVSGELFAEPDANLNEKIKTHENVCCDTQI